MVNFKQPEMQLTPTKVNPVHPELHLKLDLINQTYRKLTAIYINKRYLKIKKSSCGFYMNLTLYQEDLLDHTTLREPIIIPH